MGDLGGEIVWIVLHDAEGVDPEVALAEEGAEIEGVADDG